MSARRGKGVSGKKKRPLCPQCGSAAGVPIAYGLPGPELEKEWRRGGVVLGRCEDWEGEPEWHCNECACEWGGSGATFKRQRLGENPCADLRGVMRPYRQELDEPLSLELMARLREARALKDEDWASVLGFLKDAMDFLIARGGSGRGSVVPIDADPRNRDRLRIIGASRLAKHRLPCWAALWLRWVHPGGRGGAFWRAVGKAASEMGLEKFHRRGRP